MTSISFLAVKPYLTVLNIVFIGDFVRKVSLRLLSFRLAKYFFTAKGSLPFLSPDPVSVSFVDKSLCFSFLKGRFSLRGVGGGFRFLPLLSLRFGRVLRKNKFCSHLPQAQRACACLFPPRESHGFASLRAEDSLPSLSPGSVFVSFVDKAPCFSFLKGRFSLGGVGGGFRFPPTSLASLWTRASQK